MREPTSCVIRVRFAETDQMGVAHHSVYPVWCEASRVEWMRVRGLSYRELEDEGVSLAVSELSVQYRASVRFDDELLVETRLAEARSRRFRYAYRALRAEGGQLVATGSSLHVPTNREGRAIRMPDKWLRALEGLTEAGNL